MEYKILVNGRPKKSDCHIYKFNYGNVKDIKLSLSEGKLSIELQMKAKKNVDEIFTEKNNCFSEAMKKGMLFHLLLYSKALSTDNVRIFIDKEEVDGWNHEKSPVIYSLISGDLKRSMSAEWQDADAVFEYFLKNHKTAQSDLAASLYALLYSKAKDSETERFQYLWMAMNGLYNRLAEEYNCQRAQSPKEKINLDSDKMVLLEKVENWGTGSVTKGNRPAMACLIENVLKEPNFERPDIEEMLKEELKKPCTVDGKDEIKLDGYLNLWYPYYLRCKMFHADKPIPLFSLAKEIEIRRLKFVNDRLENYLDHNLWKYFDEEYCKQKIYSLPAAT